MKKLIKRIFAVPFFIGGAILGVEAIFNNASIFIKAGEILLAFLCEVIGCMLWGYKEDTEDSRDDEGE